MTINPDYYKHMQMECIDLVRDLPYNAGAAIKYLWRAGLKDDLKQDLNKATWYINDIIKHGTTWDLPATFKDFMQEAPTWRRFAIECIVLGRMDLALKAMDMDLDAVIEDYRAAQIMRHTL